MAQGGEAKSFCSEDRPHMEGCEYFAEGGGVGEISFTPDDRPSLSDQSSPISFTPDDQEAALQDKYGGLGQQAIAGLEGAGKGLAGPLSTYAETKLGVKPADIKGREEANPVTHVVGEVAGLLGGAEFGQLGVLRKVGKAAANLLGVKGFKAAAVKLGVENALFTLGDEVSKAVVNSPNSIQTAALHVGLSGLLGVGAGGAFGKAAEFGSKAEAFVADFVNGLKNRAADTAGEAVESLSTRAKIDPFTKKPIPSPEAGYTPNPWPMDSTPAPVTAGSRAASRLADYLSNAAAEAVADSVGAVVGHATGIPGAEMLGAYIGHHGLKPLVKTLLPSIIKPLLNSETSAAGMRAAFDAITAVAKGESALNTASRALFEEGSKDLGSIVMPDTDKVSKLEKRVAELQDDPGSLMAIGGKMSHYMPEHQTALASTAQSALTYLSSQRPQAIKPGVLNAMIEPTASQMSAYHRTLQIAEQPLVLFHFLKNGTLSPKDVMDVKSLYPAIHPNLVQKINNHMIDHLSTGKGVPFKLRRGLSMLMGQPLDASFSPAFVQAAQATYASTSPQQPQGGAPAPKNTSKLGKSAELAQSPDAARIKALQKA